MIKSIILTSGSTGAATGAFLGAMKKKREGADGAGGEGEGEKCFLFREREGQDEWSSPTEYKSLFVIESRA